MIGTNSFAQKDTCEFILIDTAMPSTAAHYYLASNKNQWNPADTSFQFKKNEKGLYSWVHVFEKGTTIDFKFTKGSWDNVECSRSGNDINNRSVKTDTAKCLVFYVDGWKDMFPSHPKQHTASANVHIIDTAFFIPQLNRTRRIWIYLPTGYATNGKRYPVMYMHDGQNLFDEFTSSNGEWGVDECLDSLIKKGTRGCVIVGIDCGPKRVNEYNPYDTKRFGKGEGGQYIDFIVKTLKPYIDAHYRTLPTKENTIIAGSSVGGLISYYAILKYPAVFGKAGIFSPSFWIAPEIKNATDSLGNKVTGKLFFYIGAREDNTDDDANNMLDIERRLKKVSKVSIYSIIDLEGKHNEIAWRKQFPLFYKYMMEDMLGYVQCVDE